MRLFFLVVAITSSLFSAPDCSSSAVKKAYFEIMLKGIQAEQIANAGHYDEMVIDTILEGNFENMSASKKKEYTKIKKHIDKTRALLKFKSIKTTASSNRLKKSNCLATVLIKGSTTVLSSEFSITETDSGLSYKVLN